MQSLGKQGLKQITKNTITDRETLIDEIEQVRENGYAFDWDQQMQGMGVIAVPIIVEEELEEMLAVACPTGRITDESYRDELLQKLQGAADTLMIKYPYGTSH